jgi:F-type H+-transporting ATPase subunit b
MSWMLLATEATEATEGGGSFTDLNFATALWAWVAFGATFLILRKVAWPSLQAKMEERELRIAEGLKKAEEAEERAHELMEKQEQILEEARKEAQKFLAETRASAENIKNDMVSAAQHEIAEQRERAKREISLERAKAIDELKRATVELTLEASARLLKRELRDEDHRRLAREVVEEVAGGRWMVEEIASVEKVASK